MKVVITGATGFVGRAVTARFLRAGWEVAALTRDARAARAALPAEVEVVAWNPRAPDPRDVPAADAVVHLAGASIAGGLWTRARKQLLWESRVDATRVLVEALARQPKPPAAFVSASGMGYHGDSGERMAEPGDAPGDDFLGRMAAAWEEAAEGARSFGARVVRVRLGMVLGRGGALAPLALAFRLGAGAVLGTGRQHAPWIHLEDAAELFFRAARDADWNGPVHAVAGEPLTQCAFARALAKTLRRPLWLRVPEPVLRLALGEMADLFLHGQRARGDARLPLAHPELEGALRDALAKPSSRSPG